MNEPSPLLSASPDSLVRIFEADPRELTDAELMLAISELRRRRNAYTAEQAAASLKPKSARAKAEPQSPAAAAALNKPTAEVNLDDL